ncbi:MAG TPA: hypothetical protein VNO50_16705 [Pyrinomonadaceae bacterium]|nr:hypothetical protein [Pyrinomonadaceae bacterium]
MKRLSIWTSLLVTALVFFIALPPFQCVSAQKKKLPDPNRVPTLARTTSRHEVRRLSYGGTLTLVGSPAGSIRIEGWSKSEVDITAEIELRADTEADLDRLGVLNTFMVDDDSNHVRVMTVGTHDKAFMRRAAKKFPKELLGLPWKIDYRIRVPAAIDLDINAGRGPVTISGIEGDVRLTAAESETNLKLGGGSLAVTVATGKVNLTVPSRSWRRGGVDIRVAAGTITLELPPGFSADFDGEVIQSGQINYGYAGLEEREKPGLTSRKMKGRAGSGGAFINLTMGAGIININKTTISNQ